MTIEERARKLCKEMEWPILRDDRLKTILAALREQDKITRHACAEAVYSLTEKVQVGTVGDLFGRASAACLNAKVE
jgi:hypothetical protein